MACRLFGAKPLSKPMLGYCQLDPYEQTSVKFQSKYTTFDDDDDFIYHKVEGSQGSRAYLAGPFNNTVVHGLNNLVQINMYSKQYRNWKKK